MCKPTRLLAARGEVPGMAARDDSKVYEATIDIESERGKRGGAGYGSTGR